MRNGGGSWGSLIILPGYTAKSSIPPILMMGVRSWAVQRGITVMSDCELNFNFNVTYVIEYYFLVLALFIVVKCTSVIDFNYIYM